MASSNPLHSVILELAGRNPELAKCWEQVLCDLDMHLEDLVADESVALRRLREASHGVLADRLGRWARVQRVVQPVIDRLEQHREAFEKLSAKALALSTGWNSWCRVAGNPLDLDSVHEFELDQTGKTGENAVEKSAALLAGSAASLATTLRP